MIGFRKFKIESLISLDYNFLIYNRKIEIINQEHNVLEAILSFALRLKIAFKRFLKNCIEFSKLLLRRYHFIKATNGNLA
ncbi:hypothetical protein LEP1GSC062_1849 [Leptospira alexanderi serovar Manhao 3 str. L 60]|uniref:Uncharacterized protein n=1 Tax=Leptospira alexanderi serovar Manhao 3 str. L 60 TaxID=1049759 RepID=V6IAK2_9LEPT|nr:hypothetical protein LEP1GSC062_1849 [Leptospira alexanderi serovar Manhao 3 str. L 60]